MGKQCLTKKKFFTKQMKENFKIFKEKTADYYLLDV